MTKKKGNISKGNIQSDNLPRDIGISMLILRIEISLPMGTESTSYKAEIWYIVIQINDLRMGIVAQNVHNALYCR